MRVLFVRHGSSSRNVVEIDSFSDCGKKWVRELHEYLKQYNIEPTMWLYQDRDNNGTSIERCLNTIKDLSTPKQVLITERIYEQLSKLNEHELIGVCYISDSLSKFNISGCNYVNKRNFSHKERSEFLYKNMLLCELGDSELIYQKSYETNDCYPKP